MAPSIEEPEAAALEASLRTAPKLVAPEPGSCVREFSKLPAKILDRTLSRL